jgi:hypothetical protein
MRSYRKPRPLRNRYPNRNLCAMARHAHRRSPNPQRGRCHKEHEHLLLIRDFLCTPTRANEREAEIAGCAHRPPFMFRRICSDRHSSNKNKYGEREEEQRDSNIHNNASPRSAWRFQFLILVGGRKDSRSFRLHLLYLSVRKGFRRKDTGFCQCMAHTPWRRTLEVALRHLWRWHI